MDSKSHRQRSPLVRLSNGEHILPNLHIQLKSWLEPRARPISDYSKEMSSRNWQALGAKKLGLTTSLAQIMCNARSCEPNISGPCLVVTSDYSGSHRGAAYEVYSVLVADFAFCEKWRALRRDIRSRFLPNGRRMSYKALNDANRRKALWPFLVAANSIPGVCASLAVAKNVETLFMPDNAPINAELEACLSWNRSLFERALRIVHFVSFFVAGFSLPNQDVLWFSDEDEIAANPERLALLTKLCANVVSNYGLHPLRHLRCGTTKSDDGSYEVEDLAAIPDLAAGALVDILTPLAGQLRTGVILPGPLDSKPKSSNIGRWLMDSNHPLKKITLVIDKKPDSEALTVGEVALHDLTDSLPIVEARTAGK